MKNIISVDLAKKGSVDFSCAVIANFKDGILEIIDSKMSEDSEEIREFVKKYDPNYFDEIKSIGFPYVKGWEDKGEFEKKDVYVLPNETIEQAKERHGLNKECLIPDTDGDIRRAIINSLDPNDRLTDDCIINDKRKNKT